MEYDFEIGSRAQFACEFDGVSFLQLWSERTFLGGNAVKGKRSATITAKQVASKATQSVYEIIGLDSAGKLLFSTKREVRFVPKEADKLELKGGQAVNITLADDFVAVYNDARTLDSSGWNQLNATHIAVRDGTGYNDNVLSVITIFCKIPAASDGSPKLRLEASYDLEQDADFLFVYIEGYSNESPKIIFTGTGRESIDQVFSLSEYGGQSLEVSLAFYSDPAVNLGPVVLKRVSMFA